MARYSKQEETPWTSLAQRGGYRLGDERKTKGLETSEGLGLRRANIKDDGYVFSILNDISDGVSNYIPPRVYMASERRSDIDAFNGALIPCHNRVEPPHILLGSWFEKGTQSGGDLKKVMMKQTLWREYGHGNQVSLTILTDMYFFNKKLGFDEACEAFSSRVSVNPKGISQMNRDTIISVIREVEESTSLSPREVISDSVKRYTYEREHDADMFYMRTNGLYKSTILTTAIGGISNYLFTGTNLEKSPGDISSAEVLKSMDLDTRYHPSEMARINVVRTMAKNGSFHDSLPAKEELAAKLDGTKDWVRGVVESKLAQVHDLVKTEVGR